MDRKEQAPGFLAHDTASLVKAFDQSAALGCRRHAGQRIASILNRIRHRRNIVLTGAPIIAYTVYFLISLAVRGEFENRAATIFALGAFISIAIFVAIHDPDY